MIVIDYHWLYFYISIFSIRDSTATWPVSSCVCLARKLWSNRCTTCRSLQPGRLSFAQHRCWSKSDQSMPSRSTLHALAEGICLRHSGPPAVSIAANHVLFSEGMCFMWCAHFNHHVPSCSIMFHHVPSCSIILTIILTIIFPWSTILLNSGKPWRSRQLAESCFYLGVAVGSLSHCCQRMWLMVAECLAVGLWQLWLDGWLDGWLM